VEFLVQKNTPARLIGFTCLAASFFSYEFAQALSRVGAHGLELRVRTIKAVRVLFLPRLKDRVFVKDSSIVGQKAPPY
jgi:hypothetical protein